MVPPTLSGEGVPDVSQGQISRCFIHIALVAPHPVGKVTFFPCADYYGSSVAMALTGFRSSPSCAKSLASCFRCPLRRFPFLTGWSQRELYQKVVAFSATLSTGGSTVSCGLADIHHDLDSTNAVFTRHDLAG